MRLNRAATWMVLAAMAVAAGCASASASPLRARPAQLAPTGHALAHVRSVAFHATINLGVSTDSANASSPAAVLAGAASTLDVEGEMARTPSGTTADATFTLKNGFLPVSADVRWPGGSTVYVRSALLGRGWHSYRVPAGALAAHAHRLSPSDQRPGGVHPAAAGTLSTLTETTSGGSQTFATSLRPARFAAMLARLLPAGVPTHVVRSASGSFTVDRTTHLPESAHLTARLVAPPGQVRRIQGITGANVTIDVTFSHWNAPVHVVAPAGASPLRLSQLKLPAGL